MVRSLTWALECDRPRRRRSVLLQVLEVDLGGGRRLRRCTRRSKFDEASSNVLVNRQDHLPSLKILPRTPPGLGLPGLVGLLLCWGLLLRRCFMYPHGLRSTWPLRVVGTMLSRLSVISPSAMIWATARRLISLKVPGMIPFLKACTIISSSLMCSLTTYAPNLLRYSFKESPWYCLTSKGS